LIIAVNADGNVVNSHGEVIDIKMVRGRMKDIAETHPGQSVILRAASDTPHAKIMNVLDALKDVGLKDVKMEQAP
jgi:biopolymer transport protein ExbD